MFRGDILLRHIRTFSLSKHTPIQRVKRVRQGNGSSSLVSLTQRCTRSDFVNICSKQFHTSTASGEDRPDFSKMASRFKQQRVERNKRRRWEDREDNGGGRRWSNAEDNNGGGRRWDDRDYKRGRTHTNEDFHAKGNRYRDDRDYKRGQRTRTKTIMPKATVIGTTATTKEVERTRTKTIMPSNRHRDDRDYTRGRTHTNEADYVKGSGRWNKEGRRDDVRRRFSSHNSTAHQIHRLRKSLNISPLTLRSDAHCG